MKRSLYAAAAVMLMLSGCAGSTETDKPVSVESVEKDISQLNRVTLEEVYASVNDNTDAATENTTQEAVNNEPSEPETENSGESADTEQASSENGDTAEYNKNISGISGLIQKARMLIPWDYGIFESMGFSVENNRESQTVTIKDEEYTIVIEYYADYITVNDQKTELEVPQQYIDGVIYIPLRAVAEAVGAEVIWHPSTKTATVRYKDNVVQIGNYNVPEKVQTVQNYIDTVNTFDSKRNSSRYCVRDLDNDGAYELIVFDDDKMLVCSCNNGEMTDYDGPVDYDSIKKTDCYKAADYEGLRENIPSEENKAYALDGGMLASGGQACFGLTDEGRVVHTPFPEYIYSGFYEVDEWTNIAAVCAARDFVAGLKKDGTVVITLRKSGENMADVKAAIESWTDIVSVAASNDYVAGLRKNGTVAIQYYGAYGIYNPTQNINWENIVAISIADDHIIGLCSDGTVLNKQLEVEGVSLPTKCGDVKEWTDIKAIGCGRSFSVGLKADGTVVATDLEYVEMAVGDKELNEEYRKIMQKKRKELASWRDIVAISVNDDVITALTSDGKVKVILYTPYMTDFEEQPEYAAFLADVEGWSDVAVVSAQTYHNIAAVKKDGTVLRGKQFDFYADVDYDALAKVTDFTDINVYKYTGLKQDRIMISEQDLWTAKWNNAKTVQADYLDFKKLEHEFNDVFHGCMPGTDGSDAIILYKALCDFDIADAERIVDGNIDDRVIAKKTEGIGYNECYKVKADKFKNLLLNKLNMKFEEFEQNDFAGFFALENDGYIYIAVSGDWGLTLENTHKIISRYELSDGKYYIGFETLPKYAPDEYYKSYLIAELKEVNGIKVWTYHKKTSDPIQFDGNDRRNKKAEFYTRLNVLKAYSNSAEIANCDMSEWRSKSYQVYRDTDMLLNEVYSYLKETMPEDEFETLKQIQKKWVDVKTKKFDPANYPEEVVNGKSGMTEIRWEETDFTFDRCRELIEYIK